MAEEQKSWWDSGWESSMEGERTGSKSSGVRHWMPKKSETQLLFLTEKPQFVYWEHNPKIGQTYRNFCTCFRMVGQACPLCDLDVPRYRAAAFSVIDLSEWEDKQGKKHANTRRLFIAKKGVWEKLERQAKRRADKGESLRGALYNVARGSEDTSPSVGEDFEFEEMVDLKEFQELTKVEVVEFDYPELLAPDVDYANSLARRIAGANAAAAKVFDGDQKGSGVNYE